MDQTLLAVECLTLSTGIFPKRPPSKAEVSSTQSLLAKADKAIRDFLSAEQPEPYEYEPPPEQSDLIVDLSKDYGSIDWIVEDLPEIIVPAWILKTKEARDFCLGKWPKYDAKTVLPSNYELAEDELGDIWEIIRAAESGKVFLGEILSHTVSPAQVDAVKTLYPNFYEAFLDVLDSRMVDFLAKGSSLSNEQEDVIRTMKGVGVEDGIATNPDNAGDSGKKGEASQTAQANAPKDVAIESRQQEMRP